MIPKGAMIPPLPHGSPYDGRRAGTTRGHAEELAEVGA